jgi:aminocarboxymuconate-semialdehyde decarboxylase
MYFDTVVHSPAALRHLVDTVGADHVLLGSDYPFEMGEPRPVETVVGNPALDQDQADLILSGNARSLLGSLLPEAWVGPGWG